MRRARVLIIVSLAAAVHASGAGAQTAEVAPPLAAPGRLVDVGGWRLHINCTGVARPWQPTVILESGVGDFSVEWSLVQPRVAEVARVCSYDRAGDGWSELGPHPRTMRQVVYELHTLLEKAGERPPFVLVGHSYGGWLVRLFASRYPAEIAGMVLVEAGADDPWRMLPDGRLARASALAKGLAVPEVKTANPLREADVPPAALNQMKEAARALVADANAGPRGKLPQDAQRMRTWALSRWQHLAAAVNPVEIEELALLHAERAQREHPLGDMPLVVLTRGLPDEEGPDAKTREEEHRKDHAAAALMSTRGRLIVAERSGHHVQLDEPGLVVTSIASVVSAAAKSGGE
jgi:pimeloyl-ACP methyl ester carboxylesterase